MAASLTVRDTQTFPPGTVVKAYQARGGAHPFPGPLPPALGTVPPPAAPVIAEGTMGSESVVLSGLEAATSYEVGGLVAGVWKWISMRTLPAAESAPSGGLTEAEANAKYARTIEGTNVATLAAGEYTLPDVTTATEHFLTLKANVAITPPAAALGKSLLVFLIQDSSGGRAPTLVGVRWPEEITPTWTGVAKKADVVTLISDGSHWFGVVGGQAYAAT